MDEKMPCPVCQHEQGKEQFYARQEGERYLCESCKTPIRVSVPIFFIQAPPYGWRWVEEKA